MPALLSSKVSNNVRDHRLAVALQILHEHFGEITRDVAQCLMSIEFCTLAQLVKVVTNTYSTADSNKRLTSKHVKQVLLLLWKHNCLIIECHHEVDLTEVTLDINGLETKLKMIGLLYRLNYDYILHRLRFGQILHYIVKKFGELSGLITEEIIFHGRLRYATIVEEVLKKWTEEKKKKGGGGGGGDSEIGSSIAGAVKIEKGGYYQSEEDYMGDTSGSGDRGDEEDHETVNLRNQIKKTFENLVQHRYLVIVPPLDLKKREVSTYQSVTSKRLADLFGDDLKKTVSTTSAASTTNKTSMKRSRGQAMVNESTITSPEELLPVELRLMINQASGDYLSVAKNGAGTGEADWDESTAPATKKVKIEDEGKGARGRGRGGGRLTKLGGRGAGRGRGAREAGFYENEGMNPPEPSSSSSNNNSHTENIVRGEVYWMIGFDQFIREERHRVCIDIVADQLENVAGEIVRIILQQSMNQELGPTPSKSSAMSLEEIYQKIKESAKIHNDNNSNSNNNYSHGNSSSSSNSNSASNGNGSSNSNNNNNSNLLASLDMATVKKLLEIMRLSSLGTIVRIPGSESEPNGPLFLVNYESVIAALRRRTIFQIAQGRFGVSSGRIIELLQRNKYLEQQTVSDRAILPARETRERLYRLYRDRWVNYVELSKRGDFNPSNNYYFWYLDLPRLKLSLLELLYQTIYNLRIRKEAEIVKCKDLLEFALVSENDLKRYNQFMQKMNLLDFSIQRIDLMILLMEKF